MTAAGKPATKDKRSERAENVKTSSHVLMRGLLQASHWMDRSMQNLVEASGLPPVSRSQSMTLSNIADGISRPADLARQLGISRQAVQQLLADLLEQQLIDMVGDPGDARAKVVRLSTRGRAHNKVAARALEHVNEVLEQRIGRKALLDLHRLLVDTDWGEAVTAITSELRPKRKRPAPSSAGQ